jgi:ATP/maltotriose-dependent transcriptional regulator MalT
VSMVLPLFKKLVNFIEGDQSLTKKRNDLVKELEKLEKPILVVLDDLDRLYPDETHDDFLR